jgi:hypothetical protein
VREEVREYSDGLLTLLLKAKRPNEYNRPSTDVNVTVRGGAEPLNRDEVQRRLQSLGLPLIELDEGDYEEVK